MYFNIHTFNGKTLAKGIKIPENLEILTVKGNKLYCLKKQVVLDSGVMSKPEIIIKKINI